MTATRPDPLAVIEGQHITLRRLTEDDLPELHHAIGIPEVFAGGWGGGPAAFRDNYDEWRELVLGYLPWNSGNVTALRLRSDDRIVGTSTLGDFDLVNRSAHIGWTAYAPQVWGTGINAEAKLLLLGTAFDHGFERIKLQSDVLNERSRAAILGIGATFEGILRHTMQRADGSWRDTAFYSILREEWPRVRELLTSRSAAAPTLSGEDRAEPR